MGEYSVSHWLVVLLILSAVVPVAKVLRRTGHNPAWALLYFFPLVNFIALWVFAFKSWPSDRKDSR
jgi:hypothetical protein